MQMLKPAVASKSSISKPEAEMKKIKMAVKKEAAPIKSSKADSIKKRKSMLNAEIADEGAAEEEEDDDVVMENQF